MLDACWSLRGLRHRIMERSGEGVRLHSLALSRVRPESWPQTETMQETETEKETEEKTGKRAHPPIPSSIVNTVLNDRTVVGLHFLPCRSVQPFKLSFLLGRPTDIMHTARIYF